MTKEQFDNLKVGDRVRARKAGRPSSWNRSGKMDYLDNTIVVVSKKDDDSVIVPGSSGNNNWYLHYDCLELIPYQQGDILNCGGGKKRKVLGVCGEAIHQKSLSKMRAI